MLVSDLVSAVVASKRRTLRLEQAAGRVIDSEAFVADVASAVRKALALAEVQGDTDTVESVLALATLQARLVYSDN